MKKALQKAMALSMVFALLTPNISVLASELIDNLEIEQTITRSSKQSRGNSGILNIQIDLRLPVEEPEFNVSIQKIGKRSIEEVEFSQLGNTLYYIFDELEFGTYELNISGKGYLPYSQTIEIGDETVELKLTNSHDADELDFSEKIGVIGIGDIDENGVIDEVDEEEMISQIESREYDSKFDLNNDGKVDIIDLSYITFNKCENKEGILLHLLNTQNIEVEETKNTIVEGGAVENILKNNENFVTLQPENGEEISTENPVEISLDLHNDSDHESGAIVIAPSDNPDNNIKTGEVVLIDNDGEKYTIPIGEEVASEHALYKAPKIISNNITISDSSVKTTNDVVKTYALYKAPTTNKSIVTIEGDGSIVINLNGKIAIKKITIRVTSTESNKLADISKVEFLNGMEDKIPAPTMDIPENVVGIPDSEKFTVTWDKANNITGYEVSITSEGVTEILKTDINTIIVQSFGNKKIKNGKVYEVKVQSTNGNWKSGYGETITVIPEPNKLPEPPDNVSATGKYRSIIVSWKQMDSTDKYNLYYREYGTGDYSVIENIETNKYTIEGLQDNTKYQVYVRGINKLGIGSPSITSVATTTNVSPAILPKYKLINTSNGKGVVTNHIKNVKLNNWGMVDSELDEGRTAFGIVDDDYQSYFRADDWDLGGTYVGEKAPTVEFDDFYTMNYITFAQVQNDGSFTASHIYYWDENGARQSVSASEVIMRKDANGRDYTVIKLPKPITTNKINVGITRYGNTRKIVIAEMCFYYYDSLEDDVNKLFTDQMHIVLRDDVTEELIDELQERLDTKDEVSNEYHPESANIQKELDAAREILKDNELKGVVNIDTSVTMAKDGHITFRGGLNAWQPLGVVGYEGENIIIYVGNPKMKRGETTNLELIATQYHAESGAWQKIVQRLKVGKNEVTIPTICSLDTERGGSLYINYTGNNANDVYKVRVSGGESIPVLDLTKAKTEEERIELVRAYVKELEEYVPTIKEKHNELHAGSQTAVDTSTFQNGDCILGATEIVMDQMMYSVSSEQIYKALKGSFEEKVDQLYNSLVAMEDMIDLFYSHKGLSKESDAGAKNQYPTSRLNIRYQRMFAGAFMYAGGLHIGIEWGSIGGLATAVPVESDEDGRYISGRYFGWGIAHEIGHIINEGAYAVAEVTNNYFSVLAQAKDTNNSVRLLYSNVYDKVTSGTLGKASNVFTQLGLYWQLHLAYDLGGYNYKMFDSYSEQFENLIFARMDTYARDVSKAPAPHGIKLKLTGNSDNKLMRLAVAAAEKDMLEFFERWGMVPDAETINYASQFPKEERAIYYITDEARAYQLEEQDEMVKGTKVIASLEKARNSNQITISLGNNYEEENEDALLGYEIIRTWQDNDEEVGRAVAFVTADKAEYTDTINTVNNRVFTYKVVAIDKYLNRTKACVLDPIKVSHDGSIKKDNWVIETNMTSANDETIDATEEIPCGPEAEKAISIIANNDYSDEYLGTITEKTGEIIISLGEVTRLVALRYEASGESPIRNYEIQVSLDKEYWETVKKGTLEDDSGIVYFNKEGDDKLYIYDVAYVKLIIKNQAEVSISEIDLLGQTGDNVELLEEGIGILEENYQFGEEDDEYIPAGSIIFTGTYKGNPAYNVIKMWNQDDELVEGCQIILADDPKDGDLGEVSEGIWIYYIEPEEDGTEVIEELIPETIRVELYRVDNALTNENERLVSDTYRIDVPSELPNINIKK